MKRPSYASKKYSRSRCRICFLLNTAFATHDLQLIKWPAVCLPDIAERPWMARRYSVRGRESLLPLPGGEDIVLVTSKESCHGRRVPPRRQFLKKEGDSGEFLPGIGEQCRSRCRCSKPTLNGAVPTKGRGRRGIIFGESSHPSLATQA